MALIEVSITPVGTNEASFSSAVTAACREAQRHGVTFQVTPTGTVLEGEFSRAMACAGAMHEAVIRAGAVRVVTNIHIDDRRDRQQSMEHAVEAVEV